jgi:hypothetical protein
VNPRTHESVTAEGVKLAKYRMAWTVRRTHRMGNETWKFREYGGQNVDLRTFWCNMYIMEHGGMRV